MAFFSKPARRIVIETDPQSVGCDQPEVMKRLNRIESNYERLDEVFTDLETRMADQGLSLKPNAAEESLAGLAPPKRKRKWRPTKPR